MQEVDSIWLRRTKDTNSRTILERKVDAAMIDIEDYNLLEP